MVRRSFKQRQTHNVANIDGKMVKVNMRRGGKNVSSSKVEEDSNFQPPPNSGKVKKVKVLSQMRKWKAT